MTGNKKLSAAKESGGNTSIRSNRSAATPDTAMSQTSFLFEILDGSPIPMEKRAYFQERLRGRLFDLVMNRFIEAKETHGLTQKALARRIGNRPDRVNRLLSSPGNWTLDTLSDLLLGIASAELEIAISPLADQPKRNSNRPEWLVASNTADKPVTQPASAAKPIFGPSSNIGNPVSIAVVSGFPVTSVQVEAIR
jgi:transcriptional regulator with XRE-family HTH domain